MLALLALVAPVDLAVTGAALLGSLLVPPVRACAARPRTVLVSGGKMTKALALARAFHAAGHRVVLVETARYRFTGHRFSRAVDAFHVVPDPTADGYAEALLDVVRREGVDVYVPVCSPVASAHDARAKEVLAGWCEVVHGDPDDVDTLDDKAAFSALATSLGLAVPASHRVTSAAEVAALAHAGGGRSYILKSIAYDPVQRLDLTALPRATPDETSAFAASKPISPDNPWILQEFVRGQEYCTHTTARDGRMQVHACCRSSAFQINYEMVDRPDIEAWVRRLVEARSLTGQFSFDFIDGVDGVVRAIECNPRTHSAITMFYDHPDLARAYLEPLEPGRAPIVPTATSRPTYWIHHELWRLLTGPGRRRERLGVILRGTDAIFDRADPLPFLLVHHLQIPLLLLGNLWRGRDWIKVDLNIGKLVEPAGD